LFVDDAAVEQMKRLKDMKTVLKTIWTGQEMKKLRSTSINNIGRRSKRYTELRE